MNGSKFTILGGGMVAGYAAKQLVELGLAPGDLAIVSADNSVPYERPPLSKGFLAGKDTEEGIRINPEEFYRKQGIDIKLECEVSAVDSQRKRLILQDGGEFAFEKLIVATGARPRRLNIPGANLRNVHYLRTVNDSKAIRSALDGQAQALVIGGGFIGMEVAAVLAQAGIGVTIVLKDNRIGARLFSPEMSHFFEAYYVERGVRLLKRTSVSQLRGEEVVSSAVLVDGQTIPCQLVVVGIGVEPVTEMVRNSGIEIGDGIVVNEYLETTQANILAAGDVANYPDLIFGKRRRVEHWDNAVTQGQYCARVLMGERVAFKHVPYFFSDIFDLSYEYWGDASAADQAIHRGDLRAKSFSAWWLHRSKLVAAFTMNRPDEEREVAPRWIESGQPVSVARLTDASQPLAPAA
jgi:3-phenylpropionate/trans-cinnamate dioxygenase ferredoxin reductase component